MVLSVLAAGIGSALCMAAILMCLAVPVQKSEDIAKAQYRAAMKNAGHQAAIREGPYADI